MGIIIAILFFIAASVPASAAERILTAKSDLMALSLEELMNITVTSVSKKEERLAETAAAIYVITGEDIRRSGAAGIPEALRMAPGLQVARIGSNTWAISSRGFNERFSNKLLVLMDGRTVYTPIFSGVLWNTKDTMLEDIERIEVIRGPGAALWGSNAVNGVINIITKKTGYTQGGIVSGGAGTEERGFGALRYGGKLAEDISYRGYVKYFNRDDFILSSGENPPNDKWNALRGGFRADGNINGTDYFTLQGDIYNGSGGGREDVFVPFSPYALQKDVDTEFIGGNILGRWKHKYSDTSEASLQLYYDRTEDRFDFLQDMNAVVNTYDVDFQHRFHLSDKQEFTYGLGFRHISDDVSDDANVSYTRQSKSSQLYSAFVHDEITLIADRLKIILGSRFEHHYYTGFEIQPNGHILWTPRKRHTVWGAVSRAVRTPSRVDRDLKSLYAGVLPPGSLFYGSPAALYSISGNSSYASEDLIAYDIGYRFQPSDDLSIDIASFYNTYNNLRTYELGNPFLEASSSSAHLIIPTTLNNKKYGETYGLEISAQWQVLQQWRLHASYSNLQVQMHGKDGTTDTVTINREAGTSPRNQFTLRSSYDLHENMEFDAFIRYVDRLSTDAINSYTEMDIRFGWSPIKNLDVSIIGQNLLNESHTEFKAEGFYYLKRIFKGVYTERLHGDFKSKCG